MRNLQEKWNRRTVINSTNIFFAFILYLNELEFVKMGTFEDNIIGINGKRGGEWLDNLDSVTADLSQKWNLSNLVPFQNLTFNYVLSGFQNSGGNRIPIVLKIGIEHDLLKKEVAALKFFANYGAVKLIDSCEGALLMQKSIPGTSLMSYFSDRDEEAMEITAKVIKKLHSAKFFDGLFQDIDVLLADLYAENSDCIPDRLLQKARRFAEHLQKTTERKAILHGDLHPDNIIKDGDEWKVIDPQAVVGDPIYELSSYKINPIDELGQHPNAMEISRNRIAKFSQLMDCDPKRLVQWTFVKTVLCVIWTEGTEAMQKRMELVNLYDKVSDIIQVS